MLIPLQRLLDRARQPRSRADEVAEVRSRVAAARRAHASEGTSREGDAARALAIDLVRQRREVSAAIGDVRACSGCARGRPLPEGRWSGGQCCSARTVEIFTDDEVRALALAGTTPARLVAPSGDHAGCAFRGKDGCSLDVADRPSLCVRYVCRELERELTERGDVRGVKALASELGRTFARFAKVTARAERLSSEP